MNIDIKIEAIKEIYDIPEIAMDFVNHFISPDEIRIIEAIGRKIVNDDELKRVIAKITKLSDGEVDSYVYRLYNRAVTNKLYENGITSWEIGNFWKRMTFLAQYESFRWLEIPIEVREILDEMYVDKYGHDAGVRLEKVHKGELKSIENAYFFTLEETLNMIDRVDTRIYLIPCNCKALKQGCADEKPQNCCMAFNIGINSEWDRGHGTEISKEEAKDLVKFYRKNGLMQSSETEWGLCNCCSCCCYPVRASEKIGTKGLWPLTRYEIIWDEDACISCGACARVCNFEAFNKVDKKVFFDKGKCWGCTICYERCPTNAISIKKIVDDSNYDIEF